MSQPGRRLRWRIRPEPPSDFLAGSPYPPLIRRILYHRGVRSQEEAARFLSPRVDLGAASSFPGMEAALKRLATALRKGETIAVYGDFDVDGITATALLVQGLRDLGGLVISYIPDRFSEGYGLNIGALASLRSQGVSLVVTADCGTSSVTEIAYAQSLGMDMVVVDHHSVPPELPSAVAIVNPKLIADDRVPHLHLSSVGVGLHLLEALSQYLGRALSTEKYLDLVALGTIADIAPLIGANRELVAAGLVALARSERPGIQALLNTAGLSPKHLDTEAVAFMLAPRLNAAGRLAHARASLDLLLTDDVNEAQQLAAHLNGINRERQGLTARAIETARELVAKEDSPSPLIFIGHSDFAAGIVGLVAGRLADELYRPVVAYELGDRLSRGSARTVPELDIITTLRQFGHLLVRFGGHRQAAGFTVDNGNLPALKEGLQSMAATSLQGVELTPSLDIDGEVPLGGLDGETIRWLKHLEPFGQNNPQPVFLSRQVRVVEAKAIGDDGQHLRLKLRDGRVTWPAVAFDLGSALPTVGSTVDIVYSLAADRRMAGGLEMRVHDLKLTDAPSI